jgi:hypothetical protein
MLKKRAELFEPIEARRLACPGEAEDTVAALVSQVLSITPTVKLLKFRYLGAPHAGRCAQAATIPPMKVVSAAARAAPRQVSPFALLPGCSCVGTAKVEA